MVFRKKFFLKMIVGTFQTTSKQLFSYIFHILKLSIFLGIHSTHTVWVKEKGLVNFFFLKMIVGTFQTISKQLFSYIFRILKLSIFLGIHSKYTVLGSTKNSENF